MAQLVRRLTSVAAVLIVVVAYVSSASGSTRAEVLPSLYVDYAMNCTFAISDDNGRRVTSISPGTYQLFVQSEVVFALVDLSGTYDFTACKGFVQFQLTGPGVNIFTTLQDGDEDREAFKATFAPSATYTAQDLNHPAVTRATFSTLGAGSPNAPALPTTPGTPSKPAVSVDPVGSGVKTLPLRGALTATVSSSGKAKLLFNGKAVATLKEGRYTTTVKDSSKTAGLILQLLNKNGVPVSSLTASSAAFTGTRTATLTLKKGQWDFIPAAGGKKAYFIVVGS